MTNSIQRFARSPFSFPYRHYRLLVCPFRSRFTSGSRLLLHSMTTDTDAVMGPPSVSPLSSGQPQSKSQQENIETQRNLKRRYNELEEVCLPFYLSLHGKSELVHICPLTNHNSATQNPGERNVPLRAEIEYVKSLCWVAFVLLIVLCISVS